MRFAPLHQIVLPVAALAGAVLSPLAASSQTGLALRFEDVGAQAGIDFQHENGRTPDRNLPETMGSGTAWLDYDRDGALDVYLVQSGSMPGTLSEARLRAGEPGNRLFRNDGRGSFSPTTTGAEDPAYGMGVTVGDYDADGFPDLYLTNFGPNVLLRSNGDGTFSRVAGAGVEDDRWSASAAWGELSGDGWLDLFVTHYLEYDPETAIRCGDPANEGRAYCHVDLFNGVADSLYRSRGDGSFDDIADTAGVANAVEGKGLGVVLGDVDDDGRTDIYVANDTQQNFLYIAGGDGSFVDEGLFSGTGYSAEGKGQAGMGTDLADLDGDGAHEILVTNFAFEPNNLYRRFAPGAYLEESFSLGLGEPGLAYLAFGIVAVDLDADGDRDLAVANGHILDTVAAIQDGTDYAQRNHIFVNRLTELRASAGAVAGSGWRVASELLREVSVEAGPGFAPVEVSRGLAAGDADGDGLPELLYANSGGPARLLANRSVAGRRLTLRLRGRTANRDAFGTRVTVTPRTTADGPEAPGVANWPQRFEVRSASSYLSQNATDLYVGLGGATAADIEVLWPDGSTFRLESVAADQLVMIVQGVDAPVVAPLAPTAW